MGVSGNQFIYAFLSTVGIDIVHVQLTGTVSALLTFLFNVQILTYKIKQALEQRSNPQ